MHRSLRLQFVIAFRYRIRYAGISVNSNRFCFFKEDGDVAECEVKTGLLVL